MTQNNSNANNRDWTGNNGCLFKIMGASNHSGVEREISDYYATDPKAVTLLLAEETFYENIWECACGEGHIAKELEKAGYNVLSTDLHYRGYGERNQVDFLNVEINNFDGDIITNPPYKYALEFAEKALKVISDGHKVAMFLKLTFLEGKKRKEFFRNNPPKTVYVCSSRLICAMNGDFENAKTNAVCYAWFVWEKGYKGNPIIKWIN